jgi:hypothetical protein
MRELGERAIRKFRAAKPQARYWSDEQVIEGLFLAAARIEGSGITILGRDNAGRLQVRIERRRTARTG